MAVFLKITWLISGFIALGGWVVTFAASVMLHFCLDKDKIRHAGRGLHLWIASQYIRMPDVFTPDGVRFWNIRKRAVIVCFITAGFLGLLAVVATIADVKLVG